MSPHWLKATLPIASLYAARMLGLFMLIPIFTLYAPNLQNATATSIGIALGAYGLSQGLLQLPLGILSDKIGRKPILLLGLIMLLLGSVVGYYSDSIESMIISRLLQGAGAIGAVLMATLADTVPTEHRTKSMAVIGITIGLSFAIAMVISPIAAQANGLKTIFFITLILSFMGMLTTAWMHIPVTNQPIQNNTALLLDTLKQTRLYPIYFSIFFQHFILTTTFYALPLCLKIFTNAQYLSASWKYYAPMMTIAFLLMMPLIRIAEKKALSNLFIKASIFITLLAQLTLIFRFQAWVIFTTATFMYFIAFNFLEANLPSIMSKQAPSHARGTAIGIYSSFQFLGIFFGGTVGGIFFHYLSFAGVFALNAVVSLIWLSCTKLIKID